MMIHITVSTPGIIKPTMSAKTMLNTPRPIVSRFSSPRCSPQQPPDGIIRPRSPLLGQRLEDHRWTCGGHTEGPALITVRAPRGSARPPGGFTTSAPSGGDAVAREPTCPGPSRSWELHLWAPITLRATQPCRGLTLQPPLTNPFGGDTRSCRSEVGRSLPMRR